MQRRRLTGVAAAAALALTAAPAAAETIYGVTDANKLVTFDSATPGTVSAPVAITGIGGDAIVGIDVRPATLQLYALGSSGQLYRVDSVSGAATAVGAPLVLVGGPEFDIDFNPTVDRLRIVSQGGQSLRVNPNTGGLAATDGPLAYGLADPNVGDIPRVVGAAYTNSHPASAAYPNIPTTTLFDIDASNDVLVTQAPPNTGTLNTVGALGVDIGDVAGFDITTSADLATNTAYAVARPVANGNPRLYGINTTTGAATELGALPTADKVRDITVAPPVPSFVVLASGTPQSLATLRADRPGIVTTGVPISGLQAGEKLLAIDTRPSDGKLFGLGSSSRLYTLDARTGVATAVDAGAFTPALSVAAYGFDFNPTNNSAAIRLLTGATNSTLSAASPVTHTPRTALDYMAGDPNDLATPNITSAAYIKATTGPPATRLFDIDTTLDILAEQTDFNGGILKTIGALGVTPTDVGGLEAIDRFDQLFAALEVTAGKSTLYNVNGSGAAGTVANGSVASAGDIGLPAGVLAEGLARLTDTSGSPVPTPTATPTATATATATPPYTIPTATPTATPTTAPGGKVAVTLTASVKPKRDRKKPFKFKVKGRVRPASAATCSGKVRITVKGKPKTAPLSSKCTFKKSIKIKTKRKRGTVKIAVAYLGSTTLQASKTVKLTARYGKA